ncbi:hypothetical protein ACFLXE_04640 [Chloroflexota bacterium]
MSQIPNREDYGTQGCDCLEGPTGEDLDADVGWTTFHVPVAPYDVALRYDLDERGSCFQLSCHKRSPTGVISIAWINSRTAA